MNKLFDLICSYNGKHSLQFYRNKTDNRLKTALLNKQTSELVWLGPSDDILVLMNTVDRNQVILTGLIPMKKESAL